MFKCSFLFASSSIALKHHTSKISDFHHLSTISTFGFRGEALSSLAALSQLTVITRGKDAKTGFKLEYDSFGKLISQEPCAREQGTTIILKNLFKPLPVRHQEFLKNLKKEFHKMINVLYGYCLISSGVRYSNYY
jgi:DNA mismatch repair protein PMS2